MLPDLTRIHYADNRGKLEPAPDHLIDVRSDEAFDEERLPDSVNLCIYETAFPDKVRERCRNRKARIVVYGESSDFRAAELAAGRLQDLGYESVSVLKGGIKEWKKQGGPVVRPDDSNAKPRPAGPRRLPLDLERSKLRWIGRNLTNQHHGELRLKSGFLDLDANDEPTAGSVVVDMTSMTCIDIADSKLARKLIEHLCSNDFFETDAHPTARFEASSFQRISDRAGVPNFEMSGSITVRGVPDSMSLPVTVAPLKDGYVVQTNFDLDRAHFGALYGSDDIFERLGMHIVNSLVYLQLVAVFQLHQGE